MSESSSAVPRPAATLIWVRSGEYLPEVLLLKRSASASFMPNAHVFAGGAVDPGDATEAVYGLCVGMDDPGACQRLDLPLGGLQFFVAAIRESFEECGLLLAYEAADQIVDLSDWDVAQLRGLRTQMCSGQLGLAELCKPNRWRLAADRLAYFSHWITPMGVKRRFDTRFFIARASERQVASLAGDEMADLEWITAPDALAAHDSGRVQLMRATQTILGEIARFEHIDALFDFARTSRKIMPIIPSLTSSAKPGCG